MAFNSYSEQTTVLIDEFNSFMKNGIVPSVKAYHVFGAVIFAPSRTLLNYLHMFLRPRSSPKRNR
jgi:hypothetical protein